ncbi:M15 family metallopeptidase [Micrococcus lylae]|uniref:LysM peptidoglycan-binding domain-containing protein n=3 Tax=Micrococcus lylae TaxID=1273 RepID=A0ABY2K2N6_9MICC|nr:LysM peptidoglycan-binding domain-containing protein [Micrococcus lylae]TFI01621.1 LysM peptidoglycan-binding domain-containing protein [Micrococcus lylae]
MTTATTRRGWPVQSTTANLTPFKWITGQVLAGDVATILDALCQRFHAEVEPIRKDWSWGWSYRPVRGYTDVWSEHAAGVAIDLNAPNHPMGKFNTFTSAQQATIRRILTDLGGVVAWGGEWTKRPDDMHFEVRRDPAGIARVAKLIRGEQSTPAPKPTPAPSTGGAGTYTVKDGDSWWSISRKLGVSMEALIAANGATPETTLYTGQRLHTGRARRYKITRANVLNVRTGPGLRYPVLGSAPKGTIITATGRTSDGWIEGSTPYMASHGQAGWWSGHELTEVK